MTDTRSSQRWCVLVAMLGTALTLGACDESLPGPPIEPPGNPQIIPLVGTQQIAVQGDTDLMLTTIRVRVLDSAGRPILAATVSYSVLAGDGLFSSLQSVTNDQGVTEVTFLPLTTGTVIVQARTERSTGSDQIQFTIQVLADPTVATDLEQVSGNGQSGPIGTQLGEPFVVRLTNANGGPVSKVDVTFSLAQSAGPNAGVTAFSGGGTSGQVTVKSDASGLAKAFLKLGENTGTYSVNATALVTVNGVSGVETVSFSATATGLAASKLEIVSGGVQTAVIDTINDPESPDFKGREPNPLVVKAVDAFGNPVAGALITWFVSDGGGNLALASTLTDGNGISINVLRGVTEGRNAVTALGTQTNSVEFVITGMIWVPPAEEDGGDGGGGGGG